jgi:hypothetical protein
MFQWPDFMLPPINLWNVPTQVIVGRRPVGMPVQYKKPAVRVNKSETMQQLLRAR